MKELIGIKINVNSENLIVLGLAEAGIEAGRRKFALEEGTYDKKVEVLIEISSPEYEDSVKTEMTFDELEEKYLSPLYRIEEKKDV